MVTKVDEAKARKAAQEAAEKELRALYAKAAADPVASRVLADISGSLANPDGFDTTGVGSHADGFMARYREAQRIDRMIRAGRAGK